MNMKERIEHATITLLLEKGVSASINEVIQKAGISKGGFYHYYRTKQELLKESIENYFENQWTLLEKIKRSNQPYTKKIESLIDTMLDPYKRASKQTGNGQTHYLSLINEYVKVSELKENYNQFHTAVKESIIEILKRNKESLNVPENFTCNQISSQILNLTEGVLFNCVVNDMNNVIYRCKREVRNYLQIISK